MEQSDKLKTPFHIEVWERLWMNRPVQWERWCQQFTLVVYAKEGIEVRLLLWTRPTAVTLPNCPAVEAQVENETKTNKQERERYQKPNTESCGKWSNKKIRDGNSL